MSAYPILVSTSGNKLSDGKVCRAEIEFNRSYIDNIQPKSINNTSVRRLFYSRQP